MFLFAITLWTNLRVKSKRLDPEIACPQLWSREGLSNSLAINFGQSNGPAAMPSIHPTVALSLSVQYLFMSNTKSRRRENLLLAPGCSFIWQLDESGQILDSLSRSKLHSCHQATGGLWWESLLHHNLAGLVCSIEPSKLASATLTKKQRDLTMLKTSSQLLPK